MRERTEPHFGPSQLKTGQTISDAAPQAIPHPTPARRGGTSNLWNIAGVVVVLIAALAVAGWLADPDFISSCDEYVSSTLIDPESFKFIHVDLRTGETEDGSLIQDVRLRFSGTNTFGGRVADRFTCRWVKRAGTRVWVPQFTIDPSYVLKAGWLG